MDLGDIEPERVRGLSRREYDRMVEMGFFEREPVELVRGLLLRMSPQGQAHTEVTRRLRDTLLARVAGRALIYEHSPFALSESSQPEPDLFLVPPGDYLHTRPTTALLVVEVSNTSLRFDRNTKSRLYAEGGVPEYWVVDLNAGTVEVLDLPEAGRYSRARTFRAGETIGLSSLPGVEVAVSEFLGR